MRIAAVASALPPHRVEQTEVAGHLKRVWKDHPEIVRRLDALYAHCGVERRHLVLPIDGYEALETFGRFNDLWIENALVLGEEAIRKVVEAARIDLRDLDAIFFSSVTGLAAPSIDARLINRLGLRADIRRTPMFGLGCVAGAAAVSRAADFVRGAPDAAAVVLTVELCSLTWQRHDTSLAHVISSGLFGDGATCALVVGDRRPERGLRILATRSVFYPGTEEVMGWKVSERGFSILLSPDVPALARERLGPDVEDFLRGEGLASRDIEFWILHPGGPKVLAAARDSLGLSDPDLAMSWESLREVGNLSSASVLLILEKTLRARPPRPGSKGVLLAMGPGFCSELLLLEA